MQVLRTALCSFVVIASVSLVSAQTIQINRENKTIAVSTTNEATATADLAAITVGFEIFGSDSQSTYSDAGKLSIAILDALHKAGVKDESIESTAQGLQRNTEFDEKETAQQRAEKQFVFRQSWEVTASPQTTSEIIRVAVAAGADKSGAIEWRLSDRKSLQAKAAQAALIKARAVAARMAEGLNVKLGALIYASNETPNTRIYFATPNRGLTLNTESASVSSILGTLPKLEIRPQTVREEATVYAVFAIE